MVNARVNSAWRRNVCTTSGRCMVDRKEQQEHPRKMSDYGSISHNSNDVYIVKCCLCVLSVGIKYQNGSAIKLKYFI